MNIAVRTIGTAELSYFNQSHHKMSFLPSRENRPSKLAKINQGESLPNINKL
jgi:hypothetical protein